MWASGLNQCRERTARATQLAIRSPRRECLCAVIRHEELRLLITSNSCFSIDPEIYRAVGLEPAAAQIVVVKSAIQFRSGFVGIEKGIMLLDTPGMSSDHLERYDFTRVPRPLFPFDRDASFSAISGR